MNVLKFGGTSVGSPERIRGVAEIVKQNIPGIVVLSAMSGTTDKLVEISFHASKGDKEGANSIISLLESRYNKVVDELFVTDAGKAKGKKIVNECFGTVKSLITSNFSDKEEKEILAQGELMSTHFFLFHLEEAGVNAAIIPALEFMKIDENDEPDLLFIRKNIKSYLDESKDVIITQGYICRNPDGEVDNLKRGGSDYTATLIGAAIHAAEVQIWTDIDGVHNNDPRFVENTKPVTSLSFNEAAELAYFGAKILHPTCVLPCIKENTPVRLKNTLDPSSHGTLISSELKGEGIKSIAAKDKIIAVKIKSDRMLLAYGFLRKIFEIFEKYRTPIDMITTSEISVSLSIDNEQHLSEIIDDLREFSTVEIDKSQSIICIVGNFISENKGLATEVFTALKDIPVRMISYGGSRHNISVLINTDDKKRALTELSKQLF